MVLSVWAPHVRNSPLITDVMVLGLGYIAMLVGVSERTYSKSRIGWDIELPMSGAQMLLLHSYRGMTLLLIQTPFVSNVPLGSTVARTQTRFTYNTTITHIIHVENYGHARTQGGPQPASAKPPLYYLKWWQPATLRLLANDVQVLTPC